MPSSSGKLENRTKAVKKQLIAAVPFFLARPHSGGCLNQPRSLILIAMESPAYSNPSPQVSSVTPRKVPAENKRYGAQSKHSALLTVSIAMRPPSARNGTWPM